jgi:hypothetical protein
MSTVKKTSLVNPISVLYGLSSALHWASAGTYTSL